MSPVSHPLPSSPHSLTVQTVDKSKRGDVLVKGDDAGRITLVHFPCTNQDAGTVSAQGHATHVAKVRFNADDRCVSELVPKSFRHPTSTSDFGLTHLDSRLITCGGFNRSVLQYKIVPNGADENGIGSNIKDLPPAPPGEVSDTALEAKSDAK